jgi:hypothetical protein
MMVTILAIGRWYVIITRGGRSHGGALSQELGYIYFANLILPIAYRS